MDYTLGQLVNDCRYWEANLKMYKDYARQDYGRGRAVWLCQALDSYRNLQDLRERMVLVEPEIT